MIRLSFKTQINATAEKVWQTLWQDGSYRKWTSVFAEGSSANSDWQQGSRIEFHDGKGNGMYSEIETMTPPVRMTFKHLGEIREGADQPSSWENARESYSLREEGGITHLQVEVDVTEEFEKYMSETFPKALEMVKQLAET